MRAIVLLIPLGAIALTGCSVAMKGEAVAKLKATCAAQGMQFVQTDAKQTELLVYGSSEVTGVCVGPNDPRYVSPTPASKPSI